MAANQDAFFDLFSNVGVLATPPTTARDSYLDLFANMGLPEPIVEVGLAATDVHINIGIELPAMVAVERPQTGWGMPCVPAYTTFFFEDDSKAAAHIDIEVTE